MRPYKSGNEKKIYLACSEYSVNLSPTPSFAVELDARAFERLAQCITSLPGIVMGNLARNVVQNVSLRDTVGHSCTKPGRDATKIAEETAVESGERTTGESELRGAVVGKDGVGMLEERDQDQPVVDPMIQMVSRCLRMKPEKASSPNIRHQIETENLGKTFIVRPCNDGTEPEEDTDVGNDDLIILVRART
jgi:hypothetical protein